jgi:hypothetical protein
MLYELRIALYDTCLMIWLIQIGPPWFFLDFWDSLDFRHGFAWSSGLVLLGFPWILSSESIVFNGLRALSATLQLCNSQGDPNNSWRQLHSLIVRGGDRIGRPFADASERYACNFLQKLAESFISPVFETTESCKKLQNIAIPDRETGLIKALQADAAKKKQLPSRGL